MSSIRLGFRDRLALVGRAVAGTFPTDTNTVGGRLLAGVIQPGGQPPARGIKDYLEAYSSMPWLRAVASRVSYDIAAIQWRLMVGKQDGKAVRNRMIQRAMAPQRAILLRHAKDTGEVEEILSHPALDILNTANAIQTGLQMRRVTQLHLDLTGEAFWLLERGALGQPIAAWPLPPHWVLSTPTPRRPSFRVGFKAWRGEIPETEFIWFSDVDPLNPYGRGTGTAQALADELETDEYAARHTKAFFYNRARPDLIIYPKGGGDLQEDQVTRLEEQWAAHNQGFWRSFRPFFLKREVEIKELEQNFRTQQLVQLREFERNTILQIFGVSPETLGIIASGSSRATITMSDAIYSRRVLVPRLELLRSVMQERLCSEFDERLIIEYDSPVVRDHELELEAGKVAPWALSVDEWRGRMGHEPLPEGQGTVHVMSPLLSTVNPADGTMGAVAPPQPDGPADDLPDYGEDEDEDDERDEAAMSATLGALLKARDKSTAAEVRKWWEADNAGDPPATRLADRFTAKYRRVQEQKWEQVARGAKEAALVAAVAADDADAVVAAFGVANLERALTAPLESVGRNAFLSGAEMALATLPPMAQRADSTISLVEVNPAAVAWARARGAILIRRLSAEARDGVRAILAEALRGKLTPQQTAARLRKVVGLLPSQVQAVAAYEARLRATGVDGAALFGKVARYAEAQRKVRAVRIARTELISATNHGQQALWDVARKKNRLPATMKRVWIVTDDDRLDTKICEPLDGKTAPMDGPFPGGIDMPPAHPHCRCAIGLKG